MNSRQMKHRRFLSCGLLRPGWWKVFLLALFAIQLVVPAASARPRRRHKTKTKAQFGMLEINSMTAGAIVEVDGEKVGELPLPGPLKLAAGKHTLKISKRGYTEYLDVFQVRPGKVTSQDIDLLPYAGILKVNASVEDARVFIDGKFVGTAPIEYEALIGERSVRVTKAGYYDFMTKIKSIAGETKTVEAKLKPLPLGSSPYRPKPPPPRKWYEHWYVWAGAAGGLVAATLAIVLPIALTSGDPVEDFNHDYRWPVP